jgi:hypothetical protein
MNRAIGPRAFTFREIDEAVVSAGCQSAVGLYPRPKNDVSSAIKQLSSPTDTDN